MPAYQEKADILILGGGFAGLSCFRSLDRNKHSLRLLTNRNHFLFTPLLPLAATGAVEVRSIVEPLRSFEHSQGEIIVGEASDLDPGERKLSVRFSDGRQGEILYRTLVLAVGAANATYNVPGVQERCLFLKEMKDARALRERIVYQFEKAAHLQGRERERALDFVCVGGGPTGVETAFEIDDLIEQDFKKEFPDLVSSARIQIIEAGSEILSVFDRALVRYAEKRLKQKGILVRTLSPVKRVEDGHVVLGNGETVESETIIWAAGNGPNGFMLRVAQRLGVSLDRQGRIPVDHRLRVIGSPGDIHAIGDCAQAQDGKGRPLPATGQVAMKQGEYLGRFLSRGDGGEFHFKLMGMLASLGSGSAIADVGRFHFKGLLAWWFWKAVYLTRLVSARNKISVAFDWLRVRIFGRNTSHIDF